MCLLQNKTFQSRFQRVRLLRALDFNEHFRLTSTLKKFSYYEHLTLNSISDWRPRWKSSATTNTAYND